MFNISANTNLIEWETMKAYLIKYPRTDYKFWISKKLTRVYENKIVLLIPENFTVRIFKNGKGRWNSREIIDEKEIGVEEFLKQFGMDLNNEIIDDLKDD